MKPSTIRGIHSILSGAFAAAQRWEWTDRNPAESAKPPTTIRRSIPATSPDDVAKVIAEAHAYSADLGLYLWLVVVTGVRRGELYGLQIRDIELNRGLVHVAFNYVVRGGQRVRKDTKTHQDRWLAIDPDTCTLVANYLDEIRTELAAVGVELRDDAYLFSNDPAHSRPWNPDWATHRVAAAADVAGVDLNIKGGRHYTASQATAERKHAIVTVRALRVPGRMAFGEAVRLGRAAAARFRHDHHLGVQALGDLLEVIEQATGIDVAVLDVGPDEHGLTLRDPARGTVFIGVARTRNPMRQRSTLAHELGHVLFEDWVDSDTGDWSDRSPAEIRADAFARHLLVPVEGLREFIRPRSPVGPSTLSAVVQRFLVSPKIAAIAMRQAGYIDEATKQEWITLSAPQLAARFGWTDQYQLPQASSDRRRAPQRLLARAITGYVEGVLLAQAIATLRGMSLEAVIEELEEAGVTPLERPIA